jgi:hypothetical protein
MELVMKPKANVISYDDIVTSTFTYKLDEFVVQKKEGDAN